MLYARKALLESGWADNVRLSIAAGRVTDIEVGARPARARWNAWLWAFGRPGLPRRPP